MITIAEVLRVNPERRELERKLEEAQSDIAWLKDRVTGLLRSNTEGVEQRRVIERKLTESQWDAQGWQRLYHEEHEKVERYEREMAEKAGLVFDPFTQRMTTCR